MTNKFNVDSKLMKELDNVIEDFVNMNSWKNFYNSVKDKIPKMKYEEFKDKQGNVYAFCGK